jgi:hypothetical protein
MSVTAFFSNVQTSHDFNSVNRKQISVKKENKDKKPFKKAIPENTSEVLKVQFATQCSNVQRKGIVYKLSVGGSNEAELAGCIYFSSCSIKC